MICGSSKRRREPSEKEPSDRVDRSRPAPNPRKVKMMNGTETYDKDEILEALDDVEDRIAGIRYILEKATIPDITVAKDEVAAVAKRSGRVSRRKGC